MGLTVERAASGPCWGHAIDARREETPVEIEGLKPGRL